ncbi:MAG: FMN-binding negative transcriptional regulator [Streptomycetaceae bacterium]|nr:FMN-binding negative transcriptional regulator [Streptomycetaceae bacterium]
MYVPDLYRETDPATTLALIQRNPLAMLVTTGEPVPNVTHLPAIPDPEAPAPVGLAGTTLLGHLNRANPHWRALAGPTPAKLVFTGPHGYVSPTVYETEVAAPTWDFTAVHLEGTLVPSEDLEEILRVVGHTVAAYEREFGCAWDPAASLEYFRTLAPGVGAFRFEVERADTMLKLSQEKPVETRRQVVSWFAGSPCGATRDLAQLMCAYDPALAGESGPEPCPKREQKRETGEAVGA